MGHPFSCQLKFKGPSQAKTASTPASAESALVRDPGMGGQPIPNERSLDAMFRLFYFI